MSRFKKIYIKLKKYFDNMYGKRQKAKVQGIKVKFWHDKSNGLLITINKTHKPAPFVSIGIQKEEY